MTREKSSIWATWLSAIGILTVAVTGIYKLIAPEEDIVSATSHSVEAKEKITVHLHVLKTDLYVGDVLQAYARCETDCFIRAYVIDKHLTATPISRKDLSDAGNFLDAEMKEELRLPKLEATLPYGTDHLMVVASPEQFTDWYDLSPIQVSDSSAKELLTKGVPKSAQAQVGYAMRSFSVIPKME